MKPTIGIFIHDPQCETECALGMIDGLIRDFNIRTFGIEDLNIPFLKTLDAVCFPGGMGDADDFWDIFTEDHVDSIHTFIGVYNGKYLGICMGAYWAGPNYFDITVDLTIGQYIERPTADIDYSGPTVAEISWGNYNTMMYFYDGCAIVGDNVEVVATYLNGDSMAIMQGNVGLIGCHPEALSWWYTEGEMTDLYDPKHAKLMSNFLQDLINE